jgi:dolichyl-phosphate mannosyltransferase polypeptide 2 regulatory subunit
MNRPRLVTEQGKVFAAKLSHTITMANLADRTIGFVFLTISVAVFSYYSVWVLVTPFVEEAHPIHKYFLPREYAITIPLGLLLVGLFVIATFLSLVMIRSGKKKQKPKAE